MLFACAGIPTMKSQCLDKQMQLGQNEFFLAIAWHNQNQFSDIASQLKQQKNASIFLEKQGTKGPSS